MSDKTLVKYTGNADGSNTGAITFRDDRPALVLGGEGEVTAEEMSLLGSRGLILEPISDGYDDLTIPKLKELLDEREVDYSAAKNKEDYVELARSSRGVAGEVPPPALVEGASTGGPAGAGVGGVPGTGGLGETGGGAA